jgi:membrane protein implicated in regulation of membrane protease activity
VWLGLTLLGVLGLVGPDPIAGIASAIVIGAALIYGAYVLDGKLREHDQLIRRVGTLEEKLQKIVERLDQEVARNWHP